MIGLVKRYINLNLNSFEFKFKSFKFTVFRVFILLFENSIFSSLKKNNVKAYIRMICELCILHMKHLLVFLNESSDRTKMNSKPMLTNA